MNKKHFRYLCGLMLPSVCVLVIAVAVLFFVYQRGVVAIRADIENTNAASAKSICTSIDTITRNTRANAINFAMQATQKNNLDVAQFSLYNEAIGRMLQLELSTLNMLNPQNGTGYIFNFNNDTVISRSVIGSAPELYEKHVMLNEMTYDEFKDVCTREYFDGTDILNVTSSNLGAKKDCWMIAQSIPANPYESLTGIVLIALDDYQVGKVLQDGLVSKDSVCALTDSEGRTVFRQGRGSELSETQICTVCAEAEKLNDGVYCSQEGNLRGLMLCVYTTQTGMKLITIRSAVEALGRMTNFTAMIYITLGVMVLISLTLAVFLAKKNTASVNEIIGIISSNYSDNKKEGVLEYIRNTAGSLVNNVKKLEAENLRNTDILKTIRFNRFMNGGYGSRSELIRDDVLPELLDSAGCFTVMLLSCAVPDEELRDVEAIKRIVSGEFDSVLVPNTTNMSSVCFILRTQDSDIAESIGFVCQRVCEIMPVYAIVSDTVNDVMDIPEARKDIALAAGFINAVPGNVYFYADLYTDRDMYSYDYCVFMETRLKNTISTGNTCETERAFDTMYSNIVSGIKPASKLRFIVYDLYRMAVHLSMLDQSTEKQKQFCDSLGGIVDEACADKEHFRLFYESIQRFCMEMCNQNSGRKRDSAIALTEKIKDYIETHFDAPDMCVGTIAAEFDLSDKYLSQFFREQMNEKLSSYIERKRMGTACELLKKGVPVDEVARKAGYWQTHTFRIAFKRVYGVTPTEYKEINQSE